MRRLHYLLVLMYALAGLLSAPAAAASPAANEERCVLLSGFDGELRLGDISGNPAAGDVFFNEVENSEISLSPRLNSKKFCRTAETFSCGPLSAGPDLRRAPRRYSPARGNNPLYILFGSFLC
jgi:hypothetical protein